MSAEPPAKFFVNSGLVSNPVDILTYVAADRLGLPLNQVIGLGTQLDTIRFRSLIAQRMGVPPTQTSALILGEHGDSMVPIWSSATVAGLPLEQFPGCNPQLMKDAFEETKKLPLLMHYLLTLTITYHFTSTHMQVKLNWDW